MQTWFKWTGLTWYTRFTRILATGMGREFILKVLENIMKLQTGLLKKKDIKDI
jgi:hypothetical protein